MAAASSSIKKVKESTNFGKQNKTKSHLALPKELEKEGGKKSSLGTNQLTVNMMSQP